MEELHGQQLAQEGLNSRIWCKSLKIKFCGMKLDRDSQRQRPTFYILLGMLQQQMRGLG